MRTITLSGGINIDGENLNHLRFADDIILIATTTTDLQQMIQEVEEKSKAVGLKLNLQKTKVLLSEYVPQAPIIIGDTEIERVDNYVYLGQNITAEHNIRREITRRNRVGWNSFNSIKTVLIATTDKSLRSQLFNSTVLPAMSYGSETWSLTKADETRLAVAERAMERRMLKISIRDKIKNETIRETSGVQDIVLETRRSKMRWAGHVARMKDNRWTSRIIDWYPREIIRTIRRPPRRWEDFIKRKEGDRWKRLALNRQYWKNCCDPRNLRNP
jgi:hypothetical protein